MVNRAHDFTKAKFYFRHAMMVSEHLRSPNEDIENVNLLPNYNSI